MANRSSTAASPTEFATFGGVFTRALVLKGFEPPPEKEDLAALDRMRAEIGDLRRVVMVYSAGGHSLNA
ncbi:MAG: hypothetical protein M3Q86_00700 [Verrucomicrobiota bacterium]|nr:hypothetical protein [Verrucomicrobiota bacterium]